MDYKKFFKCLLYPHVAIRIVLIPVSVICLVLALIHLKSDSIVAILTYLLAFYTLLIWCVKIPDIVRFFKNFKDNNKYIKIWENNPKLRMNITLLGTLIWNGGYAIFQLYLGIYHQTFWFYSFAVYYLLLAIMRFSLIQYTKKYQPGENMLLELKRYRLNAIILLIMNLALALIVFFMVYWNRTFNHHEIVTISLAAFTFVSFVMAIINVIKYKKYNSPVYSTTKVISFVSSCVSMLTLETTMLTTFGGDTMDDLTKKILLGVTGGIICLLIIVMAIYMIINSTKKIKAINLEEIENGK